ncbi:AfsR/SARP family transcriptional regulator [Kribbella italica]|uniref:DNA-binding SARP family transcriptional activator n=1 Tax=Kribbella italica TaxID=1540520 RepID=A0A7W9MYJ9_9ACTN|nr:AfsR/SARP family transcriptional regulator [Kribbella italica]MBB5840495.1 DNA-binding SARP family transcriptional activator [Kribbella italica]
MDRLRLELLGVPRGFAGSENFDLGPVRQQAVLAVLALNANHVLTAEELLSAAWGDAAPASGAKVVAPYVYRVRQALPDGELLRRTRHGYVLDLAPDQLDVSAFEATVAEARRTSDKCSAADLFTTALGLFDGEPLAGLPGRYLASERHRLSELRRKARAEQIDLELELGRHAEVIAELKARVGDDPMDEHSTAQLMTALYRAGRQAEALDAYARAREALVAELGVEPGPGLRATHRQVLNNAERPTGRDELPYGGSTFIGRAGDLQTLTSALTQPGVMPLVCVDGMAGIGKTTLAVHAARAVAESFPDGRLFVDLHGHTPGRTPMAAADAINHLLRGVGVGVDRIPGDLGEAAALWRAETAGRRVLVVLDNAPGGSVVRPLLPGAPGCAVIVTSRGHLSSLDVSARLALDGLAASDAAELVATVSGREGSDPALPDLVERCGRVPLALSIAGSKLRHRKSWTVAHLNDRLEANRLVELSVDGRSVTAAFMVSYEQLPVSQQGLLRLVALVPGRDFDRYGAAALSSLEVSAAEDALDALVDANMLLDNGPGRYRLHDLIREFAAGLPGDSLPGALFGYYTAAARATAVHLLGDPPFEQPASPVSLPPLATAEEAEAWLARDAENVLDAVAWTVAHDRPADTVALTLGIYPFVFTADRNDLGSKLLASAIAAARRAGDRASEVYFLVQSGWLELTLNDRETGLRLIDHAITLADGLGDVRLQAYAAAQRGRASLRIGRPARAIAELTRALSLSGELSPRTATMYHHTLAISLWTQARYAEAADAVRAAYSAAEQGGFRLRMARLLSFLACCQVDLGQPVEALATIRRTADLGAPTTPRFSSEILAIRGSALEQLGDLDGALDAHHRALEQAALTGNADGEAEVRLRLGSTLRAAGNHRRAADEFQRALALVAENGTAFDQARALDGLSDCLRLTSPEQSAADRRQAFTLYQQLESLEARRLAEEGLTVR